MSREGVRVLGFADARICTSRPDEDGVRATGEVDTFVGAPELASWVVGLMKRAHSPVIQAHPSA